MDARMKLFGHPIHQMLIVFPLGLLGMSVIFDFIGLFSDDARWAGVAYWMMGAGIVSGLVAAPFGTLDWLSIPKGTRAKRVGLVHGVGNVIVLALFAFGWALRNDAPASPGVFSLVASFLGFGLALVTGWLGGELINRLGVGVYDDANVDAPSSLKKERPPMAFKSGGDRAA